MTTTKEESLKLKIQVLTDKQIKETTEEWRKDLAQLGLLEQEAFQTRHSVKDLKGQLEARESDLALEVTGKNAEERKALLVKALQQDETYQMLTKEFRVSTDKLDDHDLAIKQTERRIAFYQSRLRVVSAQLYFLAGD